MKINKKSTIITFGLIAVAILCIVLKLFDSSVTTLSTNTLKGKADELILWYTDDRMTGYLEETAKEYEDKYGTHISNNLITDAEYYEKIYENSLKGSDEIPDLFLGKNSDLEKIYMCGIAKENNTFSDIYNTENFPEAAINASSYENKLLGYPLYFKTSVLYYNNKYVSQTPETFDEIKEFATSFEATDNITSIIKMNVCDVFNTYPFIGNYIKYDDSDKDLKINFSDNNIMAGFSYFKGLRQMFPFDSKTTTDETVLKEFLNGNTIYAIGTTDFISKIPQDFTYNIAQMPDISCEYATKGLSITGMVFVNSFSEKTNAASDYTKYISFNVSSEIYAKLGILPAAYLDKDNANIMAAYNQYDTSETVSKKIKYGDIWMKLEIMLQKIWEGCEITDVINTYE